MEAVETHVRPIEASGIEKGRALPAHPGVPPYHVMSFFERKTPFAVLVCAYNEGARLHSQLRKMRRNLGDDFDLIIVDGPSTDGSTAPEPMTELGVRSVVLLNQRGGLSPALVAALDFAVASGYEGIVMLDGNDKDDTTALARFAARLREGFDYVQGSRYLPGGAAPHTPLSRSLLIKLIHRPFFGFICGRFITDTTNGFSAFSRRFLESARVNLFRHFPDYDLPYYMKWAACQYRFRVGEIPVIRSYPETGPPPTKIIGWRGYWRMLRPLLMLLLRLY